MRWLPVLTLLVMMSAGCVEDAYNETALEPPLSVPASHAATTTPGLSDGCAPTVVKEGPRYRASCSVVRDLAPGPTPDVDLSTVNGHIEATQGTKDEATVSLWAHGDTEQAALDRLATLRLNVRPSGIDVTVTSDVWQDKGASIDVELRAATLGDLAADTTNGHIEVDGFSGDAWDLDTTNGHIEVQDFSANLVADTTNGHITVNGDVGRMTLDTTNGAIDATVTPTRDAAWTLDGTNGKITLRVPEDTARGYDITAETTNDGVTFQTHQMEDVGEQERTSGHRRTTGYGTRDIQVTATLDTTNSSITVVGQSGRTSV